MIDNAPKVRRPIYWGLFLVSLAILMYEILLTRIFSVTMYYHFAFISISVAMFGMTVGTILVFLFPNTFTTERVHEQLALNSLVFAVTILLSFLVHLCIPFPFSYHQSLTWVFSVAVFYAVIAIPFIFGGICVSLALTRFPQRVGRLYAADLAGAAVGCILLLWLLSLTDGPTAVIVVSALAGLGSVAFASATDSRRLRRATVGCVLGLTVLAVGNGILAFEQFPFRFRLMWVGGRTEEAPLYEKWNTFSRIIVRGNPDAPGGFPGGWGLSHRFQPDGKVRQLVLTIDSGAGTPLTGFDGDPSILEHLKYDVTNSAHALKKNADVLVIGAGGGRDLLAALAFEQKSVLGVELNGNILRTVTGRFGDFTGHLDQNPKVRLVNDEARSYISKTEERFDIIQASMIDTWAATTAGAFVLAENSLYTTEAWTNFLNHLKPQGILTMSRWYTEARPAEVYRLVTLARASLGRIGVREPRKHIAIIAFNESRGPGVAGVATILVSRDPFSKSDIASLESFARRLDFQVLLSPTASLDPTLERLARVDAPELQAFLDSFPLDISAPTDDRPFFFQMLRISSAFNQGLLKQGKDDGNLLAVNYLIVLLLVVLLFSFLGIIVPLAARAGTVRARGTFPLFVYFSAIGLGFMFIEISQMQRLILFLGHPSYGLAVVLFSLLISSSLGSVLSERVRDPIRSPAPFLLLLALLAMIALFGLVTPSSTRHFEGSDSTTRIVIATLSLFPLGLFMGMAFPLGLRSASVTSPALTPWLWGMNGAMSVLASVLAMVIALAWGISAAYWTGFGCYAFATLAYALIARNASEEIRSRESPPSLEPA